MELSLYSVEECEKIAQEASLRYVKVSSPGITRQKHGKGFAYYQPDGVKINDRKLLKRLRSLAIPPMYHDVWICPFKNGHIQVTARDKNNKKQYIYHPLWNKGRRQQKFDVMIEFGKNLQLIRDHINEILSQKIIPTKIQIICAVIYLLDNHNIRIGNSLYAKTNQSYGLTTLRKKHLTLKGNSAVFHFKGKSDKLWETILEDKKIIRVLKKCEEIPGYELFKYYDENEALNVINSQEINFYLQNLTNQPFTAKFFRTWVACRETLSRLLALDKMDENSTASQTAIIKDVADLLGHTPSICLKSYIDPRIISAWNDQLLPQWAEKHKKEMENLNNDQLLLLWLEKNYSK